MERRPASHYEVIAGKGTWDAGTRTRYIVTEEPGVLHIGKANIGFSLADTPAAVAARVSHSIHAHWDAFIDPAHNHGTTYEIIDLVLPLEEFESVATYGRIGEYGLAAGYAGLGVVEAGTQLYGAHWLAKGARRVFVRCVARDVEEVFVTRVSGVAGRRGLVEYSAGPIVPGGEASTVAARSVKPGTEIVPYYPPNRGFLGESTRKVLSPGTRIDRHGFEGGRFVSPQGTPYPMRALPYGAETKPFSMYEVVRPITVDAGTAAPWFGQLGGGTQYELSQSVRQLIESGHLRRIP